MTRTPIPSRRRTGAHLPLVLVLAGLTAACGSDPFDRDPSLSNMALNSDTMPEANLVQVPMPDPEPVHVPQRAEATSLWQRASGGFFGDQRAQRVGDILTIEIQIDDEAELENESERSRSGRTQADQPNFLGIETDGISDDGSLMDLRSNSSSRGSGSIQRNESIRLKVAAIITQRLPNGNFVLAGRQEVKVNHELRELRIAGIIRPVDIEMNNTIPYQKIAEARITYGGRGQLSRVQQPRYGEDFLDVILPY